MKTAQRGPFRDFAHLQELIDLYLRGFGVSELGRLYGMDHTTIIHHLKLHLSPEQYRAGKQAARNRRIVTPHLVRYTTAYDGTGARLEPPPPPPPAPAEKYAHLTEEKRNPGMNYAALLARDRAKTAQMRQERMRKLKAEKARRKSKWDSRPIE